ncbi:hypothetical protein [uncultured Brevundimonas sp.]|uniref:hypothetical protein n=1 Tax=uncultured Brevundimonas sp. TaxID=213418 RepID=UPI0030ED4FFA|tara:strand:+ start:853 stop:1092 length:240 start_codon:yes stop_codon:yes gene_type:complete
MTTTPEATPDYTPMFSALCVELGLCLHPKAEIKVIAALPNGLDAAVKAVLDAEGIDLASSPGELRRQVRACLKDNLPPV